MNIQHIIRQGLQGQTPVPTHQNSVSSLGVEPDGGRFRIPVRRGDFVLTTSLDSAQRPIFLASFTVPQFGLTYEYQQGALVTGDPSVTPCTIVGYIPQNWCSNVSNFYYRQFENGLLNADLAPMDVIVSYLQYEEDIPTDRERIVAGARNASERAKGYFRTAKDEAQRIIADLTKNVRHHVDSIDTWQNADGQMFSNGDMVFDPKMPSPHDTEEEEVPTVEVESSIGILKPVFTFRNVRFSCPEFATEVSSNDLATVSVSFSYSNVIQHPVTGV